MFWVSVLVKVINWLRNKKKLSNFASPYLNTREVGTWEWCKYGHVYPEETNTPLPLSPPPRPRPRPQHTPSTLCQVMTIFSLLDHWMRKLHVEFPIHICANVIIVNGCGCQKLEQVWLWFLQLLTHVETVYKHVTATCTWNLFDTVQHQHLEYNKLIYYYLFYYFFNRRFPSCISPLFQSDSLCEAFHTENLFIRTQILVHLHVNKTAFHIKGFVLGLTLNQRRKAIRKSSIKSSILADKCIYYKSTYSRNVVPIWQITMQWEVSTGVGQVVGVVLWKHVTSVPAIEYLDTNISWTCPRSCS